MKVKISKILKTFGSKTHLPLESVLSEPAKQIAKLDENSDIIVPLFLKQKRFQFRQLNTDSKIAVFFDLNDLEKSAIALFSVKTFCPYPEKFHIFTKFNQSFRADEVLNQITKILNCDSERLTIFDLDFYDELNSLYKYRINIFVLGDSEFNLNTFNAAIHFSQYHSKNYLYFHDGMYPNLIFSWVKQNQYSWEKIIEFYYPTYARSKGITSLDLLEQDIRMLRPVFELTGSRNVITNSDQCKTYIEQEIGQDEINIHSGFLPIPDLRHIPRVAKDTKHDFLIGHFGSQNGIKHIHKIISAIEILNENNYLKKTAKLLFAGYGAAAFYEKLPQSQKRYLLIEESPSSEKLYSLMKLVDIAIQLRHLGTGQASAVVNELLGLGLKCFTSQGFVISHLKDYVIEVPHSISSNELANLIVEHHNQIKIPEEKYRHILNQFSYQASADFMHKIACQHSFA